MKSTNLLTQKSKNGILQVRRGVFDLNLEAFKTVNLSKGAIAMTVANSGVSFSQTAINKLNRAAYVKLLVNENEQEVAIQKTTKDDSDALSFFKETRKIITVRWNYTELKSLFSQMMNWDLSQNTYRVSGRYFSENQILLFQLKDAEVSKKK